MSVRETQCDRILELLKNAEGKWVTLPQILDLKISQFGARILELRRDGHEIENKTERDFGGTTHSWYRLVPKHEQLSLLHSPVDVRKNA